LAAEPLARQTGRDFTSNANRVFVFRRKVIGERISSAGLIASARRLAGEDAGAARKAVRGGRCFARLAGALRKKAIKNN
jgi:hypothetical protein